MARPKQLNVRTQRRGVAAVELAIVLPLLVLILLGIIELGLVFHVRHTMLNAGREAARSLAIREATAAEAAQIAIDHLAGLNLVFTIMVTEPDPAVPDDRTTAVEITTPVHQASAGDPLGIFGAGILQAKVTMRKEG